METHRTKIFIFFWGIISLAYGYRLQADTVNDCKCVKEDDYSQFPRSKKGKIIIPRPNTVYADSSEINREGKKFYGHFSLGIIATEGNLSYYLTPDFLIGLNYMFQQDTITGISRILTLSGTIFVGDTLYFRVGPAVRTGDVVNYLNSFGSNKGVDQSSDFGGEFAVGNRWQWRNLAIGGEWFALYVPFVVLKRDKEFDFQFRIMMIHIGISI